MKIFILLIIIALILFILLIVAVVKNQNDLDEENPKFMVACAGSVNADAPSSIRVGNFHWDKLIKKDDNKPIDKTDYEFFVTVGNSMLLGGIKDKDLLVVKKAKTESKCVFPAIVVLKRDKKKRLEAAKGNDYAEYKIRRTWDECSLEIGDEEIVTKIEKILEDERFRKLRREHPDKFLSDDKLICDFCNRLSCYKREYLGGKTCVDKNSKVILSTTLDTVTQTIHFSIHPKHSIVGTVEHAFQISDLVC